MSPDKLRQDLEAGVPLEEALKRHADRQAQRVDALVARTDHFGKRVVRVMIVAYLILFLAAVAEGVQFSRLHDQGRTLSAQNELLTAQARSLQQLVGANEQRAKVAAKQAHLACVRSRKFAPDFSRLLRYGVDKDGRRLVRPVTVRAYLHLIPARC